MICDMKRLLLFGNNSEKSRLMKTLHKMGCVEVSLSPKFEETEYVLDENKINEYNKKLSQIEFSFSFLQDCSQKVKQYAKERNFEYKPVKTSGLLIPKRSLTFEEFSNSLVVEKEVFDAIDRFTKFSEEIISLKADIAKNTALINQLTPFKNVPISLNKFKDTKHVGVMVGTISSSELPKIAMLEEKGAYVEVFGNESTVAISVIYLKENYDDITGILSDMAFAMCALNYDEVSSNIIFNANKKIEEDNKRIIDIYFEAIKDEGILLDAQRLHDYYSLELRKIECEGLTASTKTSFFLEGWVPADKAEELDKTLVESPLSLSYIIRDPQEGEDVPTLCENNEIVSPYESVTNMFSAPKYKEIDPNPFVAFFFFLFYGMMLSDAGYGFILAVGAGAILAITKPKKGQSNLIKIVFMGGISTVIWGIIFGSYFGVSAKDLGIWCWFNPVEEPLMMLYLSIGMGVFQMLFGTAIKSYADFRAKEYVASVAGLCWFFLIFGIAGFMGQSMLGLPAAFKTIGLVLLIIGLVLLMVGGACGKKGAGKITGALAALYGIINFFSDLMSYTRIFGLGLATAVIGMVFNNIGSVLYEMLGGVVGVIAFAIIAVVGHTFSMAINALGSYVHNSRLQFVEFFGKFYTGGGELFRPLGSEMKYYYINNENTQEVKK